MRSADSFFFRSLVRAQVETGQFCLRNSPLENGIIFKPFYSKFTGPCTEASRYCSTYPSTHHHGDVGVLVVSANVLQHLNAKVPGQRSIPPVNLIK